MAQIKREFYDLEVEAAKKACDCLTKAEQAIPPDTDDLTDQHNRRTILEAAKELSWPHRDEFEKALDPLMQRTAHLKDDYDRLHNQIHDLLAQIEPRKGDKLSVVARGGQCADQAQAIKKHFEDLGFVAIIFSPRTHEGERWGVKVYVEDEMIDPPVLGISIPQDLADEFHGHQAE